jgi:hypothetical protein
MRPCPPEEVADTLRFVHPTNFHGSIMGTLLCGAVLSERGLVDLKGEPANGS